MQKIESLSCLATTRLVTTFDEIVEHVNEIDSSEQQEPEREPEICIPIEQKPISSNAEIRCIDKLILFANAFNISIDLLALTNLKEKASIKTFNDKNKEIQIHFSCLLQHQQHQHQNEYQH